MKKLTFAVFLLLSSLYSYADGIITVDNSQLQILGTGQDYDDELDIAVLDADGELMEIDIKPQTDGSFSISYYGNPKNDYIIVRVFDKKTNRTVYLKYKKV